MSLDAPTCSVLDHVATLEPGDLKVEELLERNNQNIWLFWRKTAERAAANCTELMGRECWDKETVKKGRSVVQACCTFSEREQ